MGNVSTEEIRLQCQVRLQAATTEAWVRAPSQLEIPNITRPSSQYCNGTYICPNTKKLNLLITLIIADEN